MLCAQSRHKLVLRSSLQEQHSSLRSHRFAVLKKFIDLIATTVEVHAVWFNIIEEDFHVVKFAVDNTLLLEIEKDLINKIVVVQVTWFEERLWQVCQGRLHWKRGQGVGPYPRRCARRKRRTHRTSSLCRYHTVGHGWKSGRQQWTSEHLAAKVPSENGV